MITIVDSGGANIASIKFMLEQLGTEAELSHDTEIIKKSSHVILPGVGSAAIAMDCLKKYKLIRVLQSLTQPVLGICLGMQLFFDFSEEGNIECLKLIPGKIKKLPKKNKLSIPHMGWNTFEIIKKNPLLNNIADNSYAYFVHSFGAPVTRYTSAITHYGKTFSAVVQYKNFFGTQFHPERSGKIGAMILQNFLEI
ncbi:imidazole glycerol phosphate synthase subunit HisH [Gammaproteobacteria bacterium]